MRSHSPTKVITNKSDIRNYLPLSSLVGLKSSVLVAYSPKTKHKIGSTVGLLGLLEILWIWNCWAKWWLWLFSGMCAEKVLFCFAKILANILGGGYVMLWSCSRWSQMLSRFAKTLIRCKIDAYQRISELTRRKHDVIWRRCWLIDSTLLKRLRSLPCIGYTRTCFPFKPSHPE